MVIDGRFDAIGSDRVRVAEMIRRAGELPKLAVALTAAGDAHELQLPEARLESPATIWLAIFDREERTQVKRGENAGRHLTDYNIVRELRKLASWDGRAQRLRLDLADGMAEGLGCAILVQGADQGPILAALAVPASARR
jgi:hypothetical protein